MTRSQHDNRTRITQTERFCDLLLTLSHYGLILSMPYDKKHI